MQVPQLSFSLCLDRTRDTRHQELQRRDSHVGSHINLKTGRVGMSLISRISTDCIKGSLVGRPVAAE